MKICFVGFDNLPVLAPGYGQHLVGGESVQQTLLARALARRGHAVSMVVGDFGQPDGAVWEGIQVFKSYRFDAGLRVLRFFHPRWTGMWAALKRADADIYYTSCAGLQVGQVALFCRRFGRRFVFRTASDSDCDSSRLLVGLARDRRFYEYGLRRADAILVQSAAQAKTLRGCYGLASRVAGMLVEAGTPVDRDIDVLWLGNIRRVKRPDRVIELAGSLPAMNIHMAGGPLRGEEALFDEIRTAAAARANITFHGHLPYRDANELYGRAKVLVNTSDVEGFPNSYLQAWVRGVPVVTLIDPDGIIAREGLGVAATSPEHIPGAVKSLLEDPTAWQAASDRCRAFMDREYGDEQVLAAYLETFDEVTHSAAARAPVIVPGNPRHV